MSNFTNRILFGRKPGTFRHAIPAEAFEDPKFREMFQTLGLKADDPWNVIATDEEIVVRNETARLALAAKDREVNAMLRAQIGPEITVRPFFMFSDRCWKGECGHFLMKKLQLNPFDGWNVIFLAANPMTSLIMNTPQHPGSEVPQFADIAEQHVRAMKKKLDDVVALTERTHDFIAFGEARKQVIAETIAMAMTLAKVMMDAHKQAKPT